MRYLTILVALLLSSIAAYFSVLGMTAIFPSSFWAVVIMASALELAKVVTALLVHNHWENITGFLRWTLCVAVAILMMFTSMGVFGFLSKAHIEHLAKIDTGVGQELKLNSQFIDDAKTELAQVKTDIEKIDKPLDKMVDLSTKTRELRDTKRETRMSKKDRESLIKKRSELQTKISSLETTKIQLETKQTLQEIDVGPIKYIANIFYGEADRRQLETAVVVLIILLVFVIDPLAIFLLLAASSLSVAKPVEPKKKIRNNNKIEIDTNDIALYEDIDGKKTKNK